jgi:tetratricopeptide (TPR) repeat protein
MAADADPTDISALTYIADTAISIGNLNVANEALDRCRSLASLDPSCGYERIDALAHEGKFDDAIAEYNRLRNETNNPWLDQPVAYAELANGHISEAKEHFSAVVKGRDGSLVHFRASEDGLATIDLLEGKIGAALKDLAVAKDQAGSKYEKADYLILMAKIEALHGDSHQAKMDLEEAFNLTDSPIFAIDIARTFAMIGDRAGAHNSLTRRHNVEPRLGLRYQATAPFIDGIASLRTKNYQTASDQLARSFRMDESPETAYFLAQANMALGKWNLAIENLNFIVRNKARVFSDSVASLIPLAEFDLSKCYREIGQESDYQAHLSTAQGMWANADPIVKKNATDSLHSLADNDLPKQ